MKNKVLLAFLACTLFFAAQVNAQHCATASGPTVCTAMSGLTQPGFYPNEDSLPCVIDGVPYDTVIQFHSPTQAAGYNIVSIQVTNITNLPCGLCWAMGVANNTIGPNQTGCIRVKGTTYDAPGQYLVKVYANVVVSTVFGNVTVNNVYVDSVAGLKYHARVRVPGGPCPNVDTLVEGLTATVGGTMNTPSINGNTNFCPGTSNTLSVGPGPYYGYVWSTGAVTPTINVTTSGTYTVTVYAACTSATATKTVTTYTASASITPSGTVGVCQGSNISLSANNASSYHWSTGATTQSISVSTAGSYTVTTTDSHSCTAVSSPTTVTVNSLPSATITPGGPTTFCQGGSVNLSAPAGLSYHWSNGLSSQTISVNAAGSYTVTVTNTTTNCSASSSAVTVTVNSAPNATVTAGGPTTICTGDTLVLSAQAGLGYHWNTNATTQSINVTSGGNYYVTVTDLNTSCTALSSITTVSTTARPSATVNASGPTTFCQGGSVTLAAVAGLTYSWSTSATTQSINVTTTGTYTVTVSNTSCSATSTPITVTVNPGPSNTVTTSGPTTFCIGDSVTLTAAAGLTYHWSTNASTQSITVLQSGIYKVTLTSGNNCTAVSSPITVTATGAPSGNVTTSGPTTFCAGGSVTLSAVPGLNYSWSNSATSQSIVVTQAGTYSVTVSAGNNCSAASTPITVTVDTVPVVSVIASGPVSFCSGDSVTLTATAGYSYLWSNSATTQSVNALVSGNFIVTATDGNNCSAASNATAVSSNPIPSNHVAISGPTTFCAGGSVTLTADSGYSYAWSNGATTQSIVVTQAGSYDVTLTSDSNCTAVSTPITITVNANPSNTVTLSGATSFCTGDSLTLTADPGLTYAWSTGATTQSITVYTSGTYTVTVTNSNNCTAVSSPVVASVNSQITITQQPLSQTSCAGGTVNFTVNATGSNLTYQWIVNGVLTGVTSSTYTVASAQAGDAGTYVAVITGSCGTDTAQTATLTISGALTISQDPVSQTACAGSSVTFTVVANGPNTTFQWYQSGQLINNANGSSYTIGSVNLNDTGLYYVAITSGCGNVVSGSAVLTYLPTSSSSYGTTICAGTSYNFDGQILTAAGTYYDTLTSVNGCDSVVTLTLSLNPTSSSSSSTSICSGDSVAFGGQVIHAAGAYNDTLINTYGCDSIITLNVTVIPPVITNLPASICAGNSYSFNGQNLTTAGTYSDTAIGTNGCDSITILTLAVFQPAQTSISGAICAGDVYNFNGTLLNTAGTYYDTLQTGNGCDSVITLTLTINPTGASSISATICSGNFYQFAGQVLTQGGTYTDTLVSSNGCDSVVTLTLTVTPPPVTNISATICAGQTYTFAGQFLTTGGIYNDTVQTSAGCDSVTSLTLTVNQPAGTSINAGICPGGSYTFAGQVITNAGTYFDTLTAANGCDSVITLNLAQLNPTYSTITAVICPGTSYDFNGTQLTQGGIYDDTLTNAAGCDSIITLTLTVNSASGSNTQASICAGATYSFGGQVLSAAGTYTDTLTGSNGCDSIITLTLTVIQPIVTTQSATICAGHSYSFGGQSLTTAGVYADTLQAVTGCDSIDILTLTVNQPSSSSSSTSICGGGSYNFNGQILTTSGTYTDTLTNAAGCDSVVTLVLSVNNLPTITWGGSDTICDNTSHQITLPTAGPAGGTYSGSGVTGTTLDVSISGVGNYPVTYSFTDTNGCTGSTTRTFVIKTCVGIDAVELDESIRIFPNPVSDQLIAQADWFSSEKVEVQIVDVTGKLAQFEFTRQANRILINTNSLSAGLYWLKLNIDGRVVSKKFVKVE